MKRALASAIPVLVLLIGQAALASEQSERLYSRGLVDFHASRYADALTLFDQAVVADPQDAYALYYRGLTHGRLGDFKAAAADLRAALARQPDIAQAPVELGVALVQSGAYADAVPFLQQAQRNPDTDAQASLFLGIAELRLGQNDAAKQSLTRAAAQDPSLDAAARYYQGIIDYRDGNWVQAETQFAAVIAASPNSAMAHEAAAFRDTMHRGGTGRAYQLFGTVGFQYDSNVVLAPSNDAIKNTLGISKQADGLATIEAGGTYAPWRSEHAELSIGYDFYQSLYFDLDRFDIEDHRPTVQLIVNNGPLQFGLLGRYDYYLLRADSFLQEATAMPWMTVDEGTVGRTEVFYRMRRRDFLKRPFSGVLDAFNHNAGVRQFFYAGAPERYVAIGYSADHDDPINAAGNQFAYGGNEVNTGIGWAFPLGVSAEATYAFQYQQYAHESATLSSPSRRHDAEHQIVAALYKELTPHLRLVGAYFGTFNNSNKTAFEYDRHVGSVALQVRF